MSNVIDVDANGTSFVYGKSNVLSNAGMCIVEGYNLSAFDSYSSMFGMNAKTSAARQFVWSS